MGYRKVAKKIIEQGHCSGIACRDCPIDERNGWAKVSCTEYAENGGTGNSDDGKHNRVCMAKQYLKEHPKKEKPAKDPRIGTTWEWMG